MYNQIEMSRTKLMVAMALFALIALLIFPTLALAKGSYYPNEDRFSPNKPALDSCNKDLEYPEEHSCYIVPPTYKVVERVVPLPDKEIAKVKKATTTPSMADRQAEIERLIAQLKILIALLNAKNNGN